MIYVLAEKKEQRDAYAEGLGKIKKKSNAVIVVQSDVLDDEVHVGMAEGHLLKHLNPEKYGDRWQSWSYAALPIDPDPLKYDFIDGRKRKMFNDIKTEVKQADEVIVATDLDAEGEKIGYEILNKIPGGLKKWKRRLWNSSLTKNSVRHSFSNLHDAKDTRYQIDAAYAREKADFYVGMTMSQVAGLRLSQMGYPGINSVGRVSTSMMSLIVENDRNITNFKQRKYAQINLIDAAGTTFNNSTKFFDAHELAQQKAKMTNKARVVSVEVNDDQHEQAPKLYTLGDVQGEANSKFGYNADETVDIIEELYQKKYMGYPRTEVNRISKFDFDELLKNLDELKAVVDMHFDAVNVQPRDRYVFKPSKNPEHVALVPTGNIPKVSDLNEKQRNIYVLITKHTLLMFAKDHIYQGTKVTVENGDLEFNATSKIVQDPGWWSLTDKQGTNNKLPSYDVDSVIDVKIDQSSKVTKPEKRITESYLIKTLLVKYNIGTPATKAGILKDLINRHKYLKKNNKQELFPTDRAKILYDFLNGTVITSPEMTAQWDAALKAIGKGKMKADEFVELIKELNQKMVEKYQDLQPEIGIEPTAEPNSKAATKTDTDIVCPKCHKGYLQLVKGSNSKGDYTFYGCSNQKCKFSLANSILGYELNKDDLTLLLNGQSTEVKTFNGSKSEFQARLSLDDKFKLSFEYVK